MQNKVSDGKASVSEIDKNFGLTTEFSMRLIEKNLKDSHLPNLDGFEKSVMSALLGRAGRFTMEVEDVAEDLNMTADELRYDLKKQGKEFMELRKAVRKHLAIKGLIQGGSIDSISCQLGYSEQKTFSNMFKLWTGMSPGKFRKYYLLYSGCLSGE